MTLQPPQCQSQPGIQSKMDPSPISDNPHYKSCDKLKNKVALITGGDSGIGRSIAYLFAREGADIAISYLNEDKDAAQTQAHVEELGRRCISFAGDIASEEHCKNIMNKIIKTYGKIDILINNAAEQHYAESIEEITSEQLARTFKTNVFSYFYFIKAALPYLKKGACIINTTSVTAYKGNPHLIDYSATRGAIVALTRSLSQALVEKGIRVNGVAPGPVWTPLIPATLPAEQVANFGSQVPMQRAGQPIEIASCYVFLASSDSSYMTGQILHPNGGTVVNS